MWCTATPCLHMSTLLSNDVLRRSCVAMERSITMSASELIHNGYGHLSGEGYAHSQCSMMTLLAGSHLSQEQIALDGIAVRCKAVLLQHGGHDMAVDGGCCVLDYPLKVIHLHPMHAWCHIPYNANYDPYMETTVGCY